MTTHVELPYRAEYAKSGRASCKGCKEKIEKEYLRLAVMVQSPIFDGRVPHWYHYSCFFNKQRPKSVGDISHFESLRWEDQEKITKLVEKSAVGSSTSGTNAAKATKRKSVKNDSGGEFKVEYSKSSRSTCRACLEKIIKAELRISKKDYESDEGRRYGGLDLWHHLECFAKIRHDLEYWNSGEKLPGVKLLSQEDQIKIKEALPEIKPIKKEESEAGDVKKIKLENSDKMKKQNRKMFRYRDLLKTLPKSELIEILRENEQEIPSGTESILDRLSDGMVFGALERCPNCKHGQIVFRSGIGYFCLGNSDEWTKCESVFDEPARREFEIPEDLKEKYDFLENYKFKAEKRVFQKCAPSPSTIAKNTLTLAKSMGKSGPRVERNLPLKRMEFFLHGKRSKDEKDALKLQIMKLGGKLGTHIHSLTTAVISTPEAAKKKAVGITAAKELNIHIVPESFLAECEKGADPITTINRMNLVSWGADPSTRLGAEVLPQKSLSLQSSQFKSMGPTKVKIKVHNGVAVDPDSDLESLAHVYRDPKGNIYNASLSLTDLQTGKNSYYKMQILESNSGRAYWLFRAWGRIGTTIGGKKCEPKQREEAIDEFKRLFEERTANCWENKKHFKKVPGKMIMVDVSYDDDQVDSGTASAVPSKLEKAVQDLIKLILNIDMMKNVMKEMEIDLEKMPLGKLSKKQIQEAFTVLTRLQNCIDTKKGGFDQKTIISCTNQFFSLIPHDFGIDNPPLLDNLELIKQKSEMLDSLMEIEIAYALMKTPEEGGGAIHPIDSHYMKLRAKMSTLNKNDPVFEKLQLYLKNTHAETHRNYNLEIVEIFQVERYDEDTRYKTFKSLHNRKLLWHGSRLTNFAGILSQGLRIAPPEAPVTGYMFGKGIYFADMVSKSANYCMAHPGNNTGLLLLCEVALGDMHELSHAENIVKPPSGKHSVKGIGKTEPDPKMSHVTKEGVEIPLGPGITSPHKNTSLLYNEYIVYDVAQVNVKYLVQVKFNFTY